MLVGMATLSFATLALRAGAVASWLSFGGLFCFLFGFAIGPGSVFWVLVNEVFELSVRAAGSSLVNLQQWTENLLLTAAFPWLVENVSSGYLFLSFAGIILLGMIVLGLFLKERRRFVLIE